MTVFCNLSNGNEEQVTVSGDMNKIFNFIDTYNGNDLGNELIMQEFVTDFQPTGVIIEA